MSCTWVDCDVTKDSSRFYVVRSRPQWPKFLFFWDVSACLDFSTYVTDKLPTSTNDLAKTICLLVITAKQETPSTAFRLSIAIRRYRQVKLETTFTEEPQRGGFMRVYGSFFLPHGLSASSNSVNFNEARKWQRVVSRHENNRYFPTRTTRPCYLCFCVLNPAESYPFFRRFVQCVRGHEAHSSALGTPCARIVSRFRNFLQPSFNAKMIPCSCPIAARSSSLRHLMSKQMIMAVVRVAREETLCRTSLFYVPRNVTKKKSL